MKPNVFLILLSVFLFGCQFGNQKAMKTGDLHVIDVSKNYPEKEIHLQSMADIAYIPLETTDDVLLGQSSQISYISDQYVVIRDLMQGEVFIFNRNGKIISHFNHRGQGDKEYRMIMNVIFDEKNEEVFVFDTSASYRILVYSLTGEYKRTLKYSEDLQLRGTNFDDETMLVYDEKGIHQNTYSKTPYMLLSKKDGQIVSNLNIELPVRYSNRRPMEVEVNGQKMTTTISLSFPNNNYYGQNLVIADMSSDTIYKFTKNKELTPFIVRTPTIHSSDPQIILVFQFGTDKFLLLSKGLMDFEAAKKNQNIPSSDLIYEFTSGETHEVSFVNDDYVTGKWSPAVGVDIPQKNVAASLIQMPRLKEAAEAKQLKGELEKLVATLDVEDNPVLMIVKFR